MKKKVDEEIIIARHPKWEFIYADLFVESGFLFV